ncbi:MAG: choice-of-anchor L domain-containing protein [Flavobacteriales bacterium]|nr:choice-of-anchor L domain-containing protein [Flavobacteriales bacterium]
MRILYTLLFFSLFSITAFSQVTVDQPYTIEQYVSEVLIGNGVTATNITYTGSEEQLGYLSGAEGLFSVSSGLVLSTDHATHLSDPGCMDTQFCTGCQGLGNDQDLLDVANSVPPLIGQTFTVSSVNDLCILEFDFEAGGDSISFNYVFGSDEYLTYVNTTYNDIFAFFLSGPGITGPYDAPFGFPDGAINIASVPDSDPLLPVTISSVNNVTNAAYYIDNQTNNDICINGYTETFTASASVQCGEVYHIKLAIADGSDGALESFVVLEEGSFSSNAIDIVASATIDGAEIFLGDTTVVEGCNTAVFTVIRPDDTLRDTITLNIFGTAVNGSDFIEIPTSWILEPGESSFDLELNPYNDSANEGAETVTIEYEYVNDCGDTILTSATIVILDPEPITLFTSPVGCLDGAGNIELIVNPLSGFGPFDFQWNTAENDTLNNFTYNTSFIPGSATVTVTDVCQSVTEATITWDILEDFVGEDETICLGQTATVPSSGGTGGFSEIYTEIEDPDGNLIWVSIVGASLDTTLISFLDNIDVVTGLYDGLYSSGSGGIGSIEVQLVDGCGSIAYSTISVEICELEFYNVFTPNSDGDNDTFEIMGLQGYPGSQLSVYDRWGVQVYNNSNYIGAWRGINNQNAPLPEGTYYYTLSVNYVGEEPLEFTGDVVTDLSVQGVVKFSGNLMILR